MTGPAAPWRFQIDISESLPPLAWTARIAGDEVTVRCGRSVRVGDQGVFEGTWAGPAGFLNASRQQTVFGSGLMLDGRELVCVTPAHTLEPVFHTLGRDGSSVLANSFPALLVATGRELDPAVPYPLLFGRSNRGIREGSVEMPTTDAPVRIQYFENLVVSAGGGTSVRPKPRDTPFVDYADYRDRIRAATLSCFDNAPEYLPTVAMSRGYDSTAAAAVAAACGCRDAVSFRTGWPWFGHRGEADTPVAGAAALGINVEYFDRLAYQALPDEPEAEFLATGMTGEDVVYRSMGDALRRRILVTGYWGGAAWRGHERPDLSRIDLSGSSLGEFRLRLDWIHLPLPFIGGLQQPSIARLRRGRELRPFAVGGEYDEPVARRLAEEAGVPRGAFGVDKLAASQRIHTLGIDAMSPSSRASFERFAGAETLASLPRRKRIRRRDRAAIRLGQALHAEFLVRELVERRWQTVHLEPALGNLLLRWAIENVRPRYAELAGFAAD